MDDGFYNLNNEFVTVDTIKEQLIQYYQDLHAEDKTRIDDFNEGSEIMNLVGLMSVLAYNMLEEQNRTLANHFVNTAEGEYLDLIGANPNINLERLQGGNATGFVKFTLPESAYEEIEIPEGTTVTNLNASYTTVGDNYISIGESYTYCPVECDADGIIGNCGVGAINWCEDTRFTVTNEEEFTNGFEFEDDEEYRKRLLDFIRGDNFGSIGYYENVLLSQSGVHDILQYDSDTVLSWVLNIIANEDTIYNDILEHFNDANNFVVGHDFSFTLPSKLNTSFTLTVNADCNYSEDDLKDFCTKYFIGGSLSEYPADLLGINMNTETTNLDFISMLRAALPSVTSAGLSNIKFTIDDGSSIYNGDDLSDVPEAVGDYYAYRVGTVTVVFDE